MMQAYERAGAEHAWAQAGPRYRIRAEHPDGGRTWFRCDYLAASALAHELHDHGWPSVALYAPDGRRCYAIERGRAG